jgi:hypothetical protein
MFIYQMDFIRLSFEIWSIGMTDQQGDVDWLSFAQKEGSAVIVSHLGFRTCFSFDSGVD